MMSIHNTLVSSDLYFAKIFSNISKEVLLYLCAPKNMLISSFVSFESSGESGDFYRAASINSNAGLPVFPFTVLSYPFSILFHAFLGAVYWMKPQFLFGNRNIEGFSTGKEFTRTHNNVGRHVTVSLCQPNELFKRNRNIG